MKQPSLVTVIILAVLAGIGPKAAADEPSLDAIKSTVGRALPLLESVRRSISCIVTVSRAITRRCQCSRWRWRVSEVSRSIGT